MDTIVIGLMILVFVVLQRAVMAVAEIKNSGLARSVSAPNTTHTITE